MHTKHFRNKALRAMSFPLVALYGSDNIITSVRPWKNQLVGMNDDQRAEVDRMVTWANTTFVGQTTEFFDAHNGIVPSPQASIADFDFDSDPYARMAEFFNVPFNSIRETTMPKILGAAFRPSKVDRDTARAPLSPQSVLGPLDTEAFLREPVRPSDVEPSSEVVAATGAASDRKEARAVTVGHPNYEFAPKVGTYWQDRNRTVRFFVVVSTHECDGHSHVRMLRVDNQRGGEYEWAFTTPSAWNEMFAPTTADKVPGLTPYAQMAAELHNVPYSAQRVSLDALQPIHYALDPEDAEKLPHDFHEAHPEIGDFFRQFLDNVPFEGNEQPPQPGERYYSYISNKTYTVVDARRKLHSQDYYITMDRDEDGHRTKFTYRNHAEWLTVWRPVDDEGNPRKVVEVELKLDTRDASEALRKVGETAHEAASAMFEFHATDAIARIVRELNKRLPGWVEQPPGPVVYDTADLIIRAIRSLSRHMRNYEELAVASAKELRKMVDLETENAALKKARTAPAIGSVWRTNSTGTYATVMHFYPQSGVVKMRSAKGGEYDCPVERLFEYSTLVRGPATLLDAIGSIETNAPGLARDRAALNELIEGQVLHVYRVDRDMHGDVTIHGRLSDKPRRG